MADDWNAQIMEEFRANDGKVGQFGDAPLLILHTTGAKTGVERETPMMYLADGDRYLVFASKAGAPTHPDWYHNLVSSPKVKVELGTETFKGIAEPLHATERTAAYDKQAELYPQFAEYVVKAAPRVIPVVALTRA